MTKIVRLLALLVLTTCLIGCSIREHSRIVIESPTEPAPVPRPELAVNIYSGENTGVCFPITSNLVVTAAHVLDKDATAFSIMNYDATLVYKDALRDVAILKTIWRFEEWYTLADNTDKEYIIGAMYLKGDSGTPLLTSRGNASAMLIGQRTDGTYAVTDVKYLAKYKELIADYETKNSSSSSGSSEP